MNVYVETNFVLELALVQEQQASCEEIFSHDLDIVEELRSHDCKLIARFDDGLEHLRHHIKNDDAS